MAIYEEYLPRVQGRHPVLDAYLPGVSDASETGPGAEARRLVGEFVGSVLKAVEQHPGMEAKPKDFEAGRSLLQGSPEVQVAAVLVLWSLLVKDGEVGPDRMRIRTYEESRVVDMAKSLSHRLLLKPLPFSETQLLHMLASAADEKIKPWSFPWKAFLRQLERHALRNGFTPRVRTSLDVADKALRTHGDYYDFRPIQERIADLRDQAGHRDDAGGK